MLAAAALLFAQALPAALSVTELVPWDVADGGVTSFSINGHCAAGDSVFISFDGVNCSQLVRIDDPLGSPHRTQLISPAQWTAASGKTAMNTGDGLGLVGPYVQMAEPATDEIWRCDTNNSALFRYVTTNAVRTLTGKTSVQFVAGTPPDPVSGEQVVFDSTSRCMLLVTGSNQVSVLVTAAQLTNLYGDSSVARSMVFDRHKNLYWGHNKTSSLYMRTSNAVLQIALASNAIYAATGVSNVTFVALHYAPDNKLYFADYASGAILSYDPHAPDPAATLHVLITQDELTNSIAGPPAYNIYGLHWYGTGMGLTFISEYNPSGAVYRIVPEPAGLLLLLAFCALTRHITRSDRFVRSVQPC